MNTRLKNIGHHLWIAEGPIVDFFTFPYSTRMVVIQLSDNSLWIWSPIKLDDKLRHEISELGTPAHLVSPNKLHYLFLQEWKQAYPNAKLWGLPSVIKKCKNLTFDATLTDNPPHEWEGIIDQLIVQGSLLMNEIVFFHRSSRTAILADLSENFTEEFLQSTPGWTAWRRKIAYLWKITEPYGWAPLEWRLSFIKRRLARAAIQKIISWNPDNVIMAHGRYIQGNGTAYIKNAFGWLNVVIK